MVRILPPFLSAPSKPLIATIMRLHSFAAVIGGTTMYLMAIFGQRQLGMLEYDSSHPACVHLARLSGLFYCALGAMEFVASGEVKEENEVGHIEQRPSNAIGHLCWMRRHLFSRTLISIMLTWVPAGHIREGVCRIPRTSGCSLPTFSCSLDFLLLLRTHHLLFFLRPLPVLLLLLIPWSRS